MVTVEEGGSDNGREREEEMKHRCDQQALYVAWEKESIQHVL